MSVMADSSRRAFLRDSAVIGASGVLLPSRILAQSSTGSPGALSDPPAIDPPALPPPPDGSPELAAQDETYWSRIAAQYVVTGAVTNMEAGYWGIMSLPVLAHYHQHINRMNSESSWFARREFPAVMNGARERVARFIGAKPSEIVISRGATEALQALISQYNRVSAGDTVMYADLDYNGMQWAMNGLAQRVGASVARFDIPEPATRENILDAYQRALNAHPRTRLLLITHCNNKTGLLLPVKEIVEMAKRRGADVVVDAAHAFGQIPLTMDSLGADFVGINLHKWIGAPIGAGVMYIREGRLDAIDRAHADESAPADRIDSRLHTGTVNFANIMTIPNAIDFQETIGIPQKAARLRYLRDRWVHAVRDVAGVNVISPEDRSLTNAISSFRLHGDGTTAGNSAVVKTLLDEFGVFTFYRTGLARGDCVRVTPSLYNSPSDSDKLAAAIKVIAARR